MRSFKDMLHLNIRLLRVFALWPASGYKPGFYTLYAIITALAIIGVVTLQFINLFTGLTIKQYTESLFYLVACTMSTLKILIFMLQFDKTMELVRVFDKDSFRPTGRHLRLTKTDVSLWKTLYKILLSSTLIAASIRLIFPLVSGKFKERMFPMPIWCFINCNSLVNYAIVYAYEVLTVFVFGFGFYNVDMFLLALLTILGAQCDMLCDNLDGMKAGRGQFAKTLIQCVKHHQDIITFAEKCGEFCNLIIFVQFFSSVGMITFALFQVATNSSDNVEIYTLSGAAFSLYLQIFAYCWFGDKIDTKSRKILRAVFETEWTDESACVKQLVLIFMAKSQNPLRVSAFNLIDLSFDLFLKVMRNTWSYFMVLQQLSN